MRRDASERPQKEKSELNVFLLRRRAVLFLLRFRLFAPAPPRLFPAFGEGVLLDFDQGVLDLGDEDFCVLEFGKGKGEEVLSFLRA